MNKMRELEEQARKSRRAWPPARASVTLISGAVPPVVNDDGPPAGDICGLISGRVMCSGLVRRVQVQRIFFMSEGCGLLSDYRQW